MRKGKLINIEQLKREVATEMGIDNIDELAYITEELLIDYLFSDVQEDVKQAGESQEEAKNVAASGGCSYGVYGNSLITSSNAHPVSLVRPGHNVLV